MGANSSSLSELSSNEFLKRLSSSECLSPNDPFWNQLLSFTFIVPRNSVDQHLLEETTANICKNFAINNCRTGNFGALLHVFLLRAAELQASAQCEDNIFTWQTYNALFIIRNLCKYFVENLTEEVVLQQFSAVAPGEESGDERRSLVDALLDSLVRVLTDVPVVDLTYAIHLECISTLVTLLSLQLYQSAPTTDSQLYRYVMNGRCSHHAAGVVQVLLNNYVQQAKCPAGLHGNGTQHGMLYGLTAAVASGLWTVMTLGLASQKSASKSSDEPSDTLLADQSLLLLLVLTNHYFSDGGFRNPYRDSFLSCIDIHDVLDTASSVDPLSSSSAPIDLVPKVKVNFGDLYNTLCQTLKDEQTTLFLYMLLHSIERVKAFILSRTNIDQLVMPILKILYHAPEGSSHHIYMALIVILILSEDHCFSKAIHETMLKNISWFQERQIGEIALGGLLVLVLVRTIQFNMTRMRDQYLHTNCLAALANMSSQFNELHPYVAQRLVSLFALLLKKYTRTVEHIKSDEGSNHVLHDSDTESQCGGETDYVKELAILEEVMRMTLEILNSCLTHALHRNPNLLYTMLYQSQLFGQLRSHPNFQDIILNIDMVLNYFTSRLEAQGGSLSVTEVHAMIKQGAVQFKRDRLKKFPELKFRYVEEEKPEDFFIPYVWSLVYHSSNLYFNPSRVQLVTLQLG